jgi:hypothetical protein
VQHGGTPNLSKEVRAIPHFGMVCAPWFNTNTQKSLPRSQFETLSLEGQHACRYIVADTDEVGPFPNREHPSLVLTAIKPPASVVFVKSVCIASFMTTVRAFMGV